MQAKINMNTAVIDPAITPGCCPLFLVPTDIHVHGHLCGTKISKMPMP